jgi:hypothetical protein
MRARFIKETGTRCDLRVYWDVIRVTAVEPYPDCPEGHSTVERANECPNSYGLGKPGIHNATVHVRDSEKPEDWDGFGVPEDYPDDRWPTKCDFCGAAVPPMGTGSPTMLGSSGVDVHRQVFTRRLYDTASGRPEPGDLYYVSNHDGADCPYWDNCPGVHLHGVTPNGEDWDIDGRASNCTMREERAHRCWVLHGRPEDGNVHVDKAGHTCAAGAGSIQVRGWHGFLHGMSWNG